MKKFENVKVIVADIDQTICARLDHVLEEETVNTMKKMQERGILFGLASGRSVSDIRNYYKIWGLEKEPDFYIGMNGAMLYDTRKDEFLNGYMMNAKQIKEVYDHYASLGFPTSIYCEDDVNYLIGKSELVQESVERNLANVKYKFVDKVEDIGNLGSYRILYRCYPEQMGDLIEYSKKNPLSGYDGFQTQETCYEVMLEGVSKGSALVQYCENNGIDMDAVIAFGDTGNDIAMLKCAHGIGMLNSTEDVKEIAEDITEYACADNGFARYIEKHIL